jgi:hypothetical protein
MNNNTRRQETTYTGGGGNSAMYGVDQEEEKGIPMGQTQESTMSWRNQSQMNGGGRGGG